MADIFVELNFTPPQVDELLTGLNDYFKDISLSEAIQVCTHPKELLDHIPCNLNYKQLYALSKKISSDIIPSQTDFNTFNICVHSEVAHKYKLPDLLRYYVYMHSDQIKFKDDTTLKQYLKLTNKAQIFESVSNTFLELVLSEKLTLHIGKIEYGSSYKHKTDPNSEDRFALWVQENWTTHIWQFLRKIATKNTLEDFINPNSYITI